MAAIAAAMILTSPAFAQDLRENVTVRYDRVPELRDYEKLNINPRIDLSAVRLSALPYSTRQVKVAVPGSIPTLAPAAYADSIYTSPYRGYAALGFMPAYNLGASAGYKIFDTDHTRLNAWLQYNGTSYKGSMMPVTPGEDAGKMYVRRNTATLGAALHQAVGSESFIDAGIDYTYARFSTPRINDRHNQSAHRFNASAMWTLDHADFHYGIGAEYGRFAYVNTDNYTIIPSIAPLWEDLKVNPARENRVKANGFFYGRFAGASAAGMDVSFTYTGYSRNYGYACATDRVMLVPFDKPHFSMLHMHPFYRFDINRVAIDLGLNIDLRFNSGKMFHIAPQASATWTPCDIVKVYAKAQGGQWENTLGSLFDITPYAFPFSSYRNSSIPVEAEAGVTIGLWKGFYAEISASYAIADDWLMPVINATADELTAATPQTAFTVYDFKSLKISGTIGYNYRNIVDLKASFEAAPQKKNRGYYLWRDRAKHVASVDLRVTPIRQLDIDLGWEYRGGRAISYTSLSTDFPLPADQPIATTKLRSLGSVSNLKAGALYRITDRWSAFIRGENLLNRHCFLIGGVPAQGITGLVGATYKF